MSQDDYNRLRKHVDFLESLLAVLVIALFVLAMFRPDGELLIALAVVVTGVLLNLYRQHQLLSRFTCPGCGELPHSKTDHVAGDLNDPATPNCLHCGHRLSE